MNGAPQGEIFSFTSQGDGRPGSLPRRGEGKRGRQRICFLAARRNLNPLGEKEVNSKPAVFNVPREVEREEYSTVLWKVMTSCSKRWHAITRDTDAQDIDIKARRNSGSIRSPDGRVCPCVY